MKDENALARTFLQRLESLNNLVRRRSSLTLTVPTADDDGNTERNCGDVNDTESLERPILMEIENTDAAKRLEMLFDRFVEEKKDPTLKSNKKSKSSCRNQMRESKKQKIIQLQNQLKKRHTRHLSRSANTLIFRLGDKAACSGDVDIYPIKKNEMDAKLFLSLSCEKLSIERGYRLLKSCSTHEISQDLFVTMFWFAHCRFFQKNSLAEQRFLMVQLSQQFSKFLELLTKSSAFKQRDVIFRVFPFVVSKAIHLGFTFLCPGNRSLFRGSFQKVLNTSTFKLLTGLDIANIHTIVNKLYPEDEKMHREDASEEIDSIEETFEITRRQMSGCSFDRSFISHTKAPGDGLVRHQNRILFDTRKLSPLLSQYLGRDSLNIGSKHLVKRTEPVVHCSVGGLDTFQPRYEEKSLLLEKQRLEHHEKASIQMKFEKLKSKEELQKDLKTIAKAHQQTISSKKKMVALVQQIVTGEK
ncbi:hypothetical protein CTEN210_08648 [Chaetoceros tenuissimus]|uniref:Uncharacterized protein n=1 Tax=Chaetoceros tenuissimus TaxID=426638 RepID=A0AAD3H694_9STRA|nr:hypothetical protein CTEN210_08648 [Chaetoceros tenuissimus]